MGGERKERQVGRRWLRNSSKEKQEKDRLGNEAGLSPVGSPLAEPCSTRQGWHFTSVTIIRRHRYFSCQDPRATTKVT